MRTLEHLTERDTERETVRVSVRELAEVTRWAFIASGCSAGEAAVAARVVQLAEVSFGCGVDAAVNELTNHRFSAHPIRRLMGPVETIDDEHNRGLLCLGPLAAALACSRGQDGGVVVLRNTTWHPVIGAILIDAMRSTCPNVAALAAWYLPAPGRDPGEEDPGLHRGVIANAHLYTIESFGPETTPSPIDGLAVNAGLRGGLAFAPVEPTVGSTPTMVGPDALTAALADGVNVDQPNWASLYRSAQRFLVVDS